MQSAAIETLESRLLLKANPMGIEYTVNSSYIPGQETLSDSSANAIASDHDGNYVVTWTSTGLPNDSHDGSFSGVYAQLYQADGTKIGTEFRVNTTTFGHQLDSTVGMNDTGDFVIAWTAQDNQDGSLSGVYAQQYAADGTKKGSEFRVNSNTNGLQASPSVAVSADGSFVIVWQDTSPAGGAEIRGQNYLANRATILGEFVVNSSAGSTTAGNASVSMADDKSFVVAWSSTGSAPGVYTRRYTTAGTPAAAESRVSPNGGGTPVGLDVDSSGNYVVSWLQQTSGSNSDVFVRKFDLTGAGQGTAFQVNSPTAPGQFRNRTAPRVGLADSGRVFVTWMEATPLSLGFKNFGIWMREFKPDRTADGFEFQVNTKPAGQDGSFGPSAVSVDGLGDIRVVWQTDVTGTTGTTNDIHGQNFNRAHRPTDIILSDYTVDENLPAGTLIAGLGAVDQDPADTFLWDLVPGAGDNGFFSIDPFGNELLTADTFDFEGQSSYSIVVRVKDSWGYVFQKTIIISINNVNEAPNLVTTSLTVPENSPQGFQIGKIVALDPDFNQSLSYSITAGNANGAFALNAATGMLTVNTPSLINFEALSSITLDITVNDNGSPRKGAAGKVVVKITNVNEKPTALNLVPSAIPENQLIGTMVGNFATTDPDNGDKFTYSLVTGTGDTDNAMFTVSGNQLQSAAVFDFETKTSYKVRVRTTDLGGLFVEKALVIGILNQNEQPAISNAAFSVPENSPTGTVVGQLTASDVDVGSVLSYTITAGNSSGAFSVNPQGQVIVANPAALNFETTPNFALTVKVSDSGSPTLSQTASVTVTLTDVFENPTAVALTPASLLENQSSGTLIGTLSTTDSDIGETYTYALVNGVGAADNGSVNIVGNQLFTTTPLNREIQPTLNVRIQTTDSHGLAFEQPLTINVLNVNETPTALQLSAQTVAENQPGNTLVGSFLTTDPDLGDGFTYSLVSGSG
ncbi:MAG: cya 3, partial [Planctomycetaceae bacterium]|nr:cya 3 [Planctomycetaceae bacterium]